MQSIGQSLERAAAPATTNKSATSAESLEGAIFWAFVAGLAWCPFWFGSNTVTAWGINAVIFPGLAVLYELTLLVRGKRHPVSIMRVAVPAVLFCAVILWIFVQSGTWTPATIQNPIWKMASDALGVPLAGSISVNRDLTVLGALRLLTLASVFWIALQLCRNEVRANQFVVAIVVVGVCYGFYGLIALTVAPGYTLWFENKFSLGTLTSTFYNRNTYAAYGGIALVAVAALIFRLYRHDLSAHAGPRRYRIASIIEATGQRGAGLFSAAFIVLASVLLTGSRGGFISAGIGLFVLSVFTFGRRQKQLADYRDILIVGAVVAAVALAAFGDVLAGRIDQQGLFDAGRWNIYAITIGSILDTPLSGYGYGTFADVFPMFRDQSIGIAGTWEMAHNTYLEVFQGLGLLFGVMLVGCVGILVFKCAKGSVLRKKNATIPRIATSVAFLVGVNAIVDFSLQIEAVALTFAAVLGAGVAQSESSQTSLSD